jgi:hypothetical protein
MVEDARQNFNRGNLRAASQHHGRESTSTFADSGLIRIKTNMQ